MGMVFRAGRPLAPNPAGAHLLRDRQLITALARASGAVPARLVLDLGPGSGAITAGLAAAGARVIAVERDPKHAARPRRRFGDELLVRVAEADLRVRVFVSSTLTELAAEGGMSGPPQRRSIGGKQVVRGRRRVAGYQDAIYQRPQLSTVADAHPRAANIA